jgi:hypothetical protein
MYMLHPLRHDFASTSVGKNARAQDNTPKGARDFIFLCHVVAVVGHRAIEEHPA